MNGYVCGYNGVRGNHGMVDVNNCGTGYTDKGNVTG